VDTAQTVPFPTAGRNAKALLSNPSHAFDPNHDLPVGQVDQGSMSKIKSVSRKRKEINFHSRRDAFFVTCSTAWMPNWKNSSKPES
jgi:hypothetical protein